MQINEGTHALVLSGGGGYAAYEVGVMKALAAGLSPATQHAPVDPGILTGTSAGALNASFLTARGHLSFVDAVFELERFWLDRLAKGGDECRNGVFRIRADVGSLFNAACWSDRSSTPLSQFANDVAYFANDWAHRMSEFVTTGGRLQTRLLSLVDLSSLFDADAYLDLIREAIDFEAIRAADRRLIVAVTNWQDGSLNLLRNEHFIDSEGANAIAASSALPGIFPPIDLAGSLHVDGGVLTNAPLKPAIDIGAGTLHVVYMDPDVSSIPISALRNTMETMDRVLVIQRANVLNLDIEQAARVNRGLELVTNPELLRGEGVRAALITFAGRLGRRFDAARVAEDTIAAVAQRVSTGYRQLTIHRYHPREDLGGLAGALRLDHDGVVELIAKGFEDTLAHDCAVCDCIAPSGVQLRALAPGSDA